MPHLRYVANKLETTSYQFLKLSLYKAFYSLVLFIYHITLKTYKSIGISLL